MVYSIHALLVRANNHAELIDFEELFNLVGSIAHNVVLVLRVSHQVLMHAKLVFTLSWVTPEQVHCHLLHSVVNLTQINLQRSTDLFNVLQLLDCGPKATINTEDFVIGRLVANDSGKRKPLKQVIHLLENTVWLIDVLSETLGALLAEA